jgi:hypothetical protein
MYSELPIPPHKISIDQKIVARFGKAQAFAAIPLPPVSGERGEASTF